MKTLDGQTLRDMTDDEKIVYENNLANINAAEEAAKEKIAARVSAVAKLTALGLTEAEVSALLGA